VSRTRERSVVASLPATFTAIESESPPKEERICVTLECICGSGTRILRILRFVHRSRTVFQLQLTFRVETPRRAWSLESSLESRVFVTPVPFRSGQNGDVLLQLLQVLTGGHKPRVFGESTPRVCFTLKSICKFPFTCTWTI